MRPDVTGRLEQRINDELEDAGFDNGADFVRYCVRKELDRREELSDE